MDNASQNGVPVTGAKRVIAMVVIVLIVAAAGFGVYWLFGKQGGGLLRLPGIPSSNMSDAAKSERDQKRNKHLALIDEKTGAFYTKYTVYPTSLFALTDLTPTPSDPLTKKVYEYTPLNGNSSYALEVTVEKEVTIRGATYAAGVWIVYPNEVRAKGESASKVVVQQGSASTNSDAPKANPSDLGNADLDSDGLTMYEERVFKSDPLLKDTDGDGFSDGEEVKNFFDPSSKGSVKLDTTGTLLLYKGTAVPFKFYYPAAWTVSEKQGSVLIQSTTGETFDMRVLENPTKLSSFDWYVRTVSYNYDPKSVETVTIGGAKAVRTLDGSGTYLAVGDQVYFTSYQTNSAYTINYPVLFSDIIAKRMIIK